MLASARQPAHARERVTDLRGIVVPLATPAVLADPTGHRARRLHVAGRILAAVLLVWLCGLVLAGLGLLPLDDVPLGNALRAAGEPARLAVKPVPRQPARSDLRPARPLANAAAGAGHATSAHSGAAARRLAGVASPSSSHRRSGRGRSGGPSSGSVTSRPGSATTPAVQTGQTTQGSAATSRGSGKTGRGQGSTHSGGAGGSGTTTTAPGSSGSAPGHDPTRTTGHGPKSKG